MTQPSTQKIISCAPGLLYNDSNFHDNSMFLSDMAKFSSQYADEFDVFSKLFEESRYSRPLPQYINGPHTEDTNAVISHFLDVNKHYTHASPVYCVKIRKAIVWQNMVFVVAGGDVFPLYENFRAIDRKEKGINIALRLAETSERRVVNSMGDNPIFFGSVGSFNYGHWLVDDFPRYKAILLPELKEKNCICFFSQLDSAIDAIRVEALGFIKEDGRISSAFIDPSIPHEFSNLIYVTPCSEHPFIKNHSAITFSNQIVRNTVPSPRPKERIFVNRSPDWPRHITNGRDVLSLLRRYNFREITPDCYNFRDQIELFSNASLVVGIMGAGMTNTIFCDKGTRILHLAPSGWQEPFFWDLAASCQHTYYVLFGEAADEEARPLHQKSFEVNLMKMAEALSKITSAQEL